MKEDARELLAKYKNTPSILYRELHECNKLQKGRLLEEVVAELYRGNGYIAMVAGGRGDSGADVLLYDRKDPERVLRVIQTKNHASPLPYDDIRTELRKFEEEASQRYNCNEYELISLNGFSKSSTTRRTPKSLQRFNLQLADWGHIEKLVETYDPSHNTAPELTLKSHNRDTLDKVLTLFQEHKRVCVIQATGTGKRYLVASYILSRPKKRVLFLSPSNHINSQQRAMLPDVDVTYSTYYSLSNFLKPSFNIQNYDCIVLDEFHRLGAEKWGEEWKEVINKNVDAEVFGVTATSVRDLDGQRDMKQELFNGICANEIPLYEAIVRKILPTPKYITASTDIEEIIRNTQRELDTYQDDEVIVNYRKVLKNSFSKLDKTHGIPSILNRHLPNMAGKYHVFCESIGHLEDSIEEVRKWFRQAAKESGQVIGKITDITIHSRLPAIQIQSASEEAKAPLSDGEIRLIFSVNILNEGVHWDDITRSIHLRRTKSKLLHYQQIGRCFSAGGEDNPIIFDFVSNISAVDKESFGERLRVAAEREKELRHQYGLAELDFKFHTYEEHIDILNELLDIHHHVIGWQNSYNQLKIFIQEEGHANVPSSNQKLYCWLRRQKMLMTRGALKACRQKKLANLGVDFAIELEIWNKNINIANRFFSTNDRFPAKHESNTEFNIWVDHISREGEKNKLHPILIQNLERLNFIWDQKERSWDSHFRAAVDLVRLTGDRNIDLNCRHGGLDVGAWLFRTQAASKLGRLTADQKAKYARSCLVSPI